MAFVADMRHLTSQTVVVFPTLGSELPRRLQITEKFLTRSLGLGLGVEVVKSASSTRRKKEVSSPKTLFTLLVETVHDHLLTFARVIEALDSSSFASGLCAWADFLDTLLEGVLSFRTHLTPFELDAKRFLVGQRLLATVTAARNNLSDSLSVFVTRMRRTSIFDRVEKDSRCFVRALGREVSSSLCEAKLWWAVGEEDRELEENAWYNAESCVETRKALLMAAQGVVKCADVVLAGHSCTSHPCAAEYELVVLKMARTCTLECVIGEPGYVRTCTRWDPGFVLLSDPATGVVLERFLAVLVKHFPMELRWSSLPHIVFLLADYLHRKPFQSSAVLQAVCEVSDAAAFMISEAIRITQTKADGYRDPYEPYDKDVDEAGDEAGVDPDYFNSHYRGSRPRMWAFSRRRLRFWWCVESACPDKGAITRWQSMVLDGVIRHLQNAINAIIAMNDLEDDDDYYEDATRNWFLFKREAMIIVDETKRAQEVQHAVMEALAASPDGIMEEFVRQHGGLEDFLQLCRGVNEWSPLRSEWSGAVYRGGKARERAIIRSFSRLGSGSASRPRRRRRQKL